MSALSERGRLRLASGVQGARPSGAPSEHGRLAIQVILSGSDWEMATVGPGHANAEAGDLPVDKQESGGPTRPGNMERHITHRGLAIRRARPIPMAVLCFRALCRAVCRSGAARLGARAGHDRAVRHKPKS